MGTTKENLEMNFKGETTEVGLYLAMALRAEADGYPDIALYLKQIALEEAAHAAEAALALDLVADTKSNLEKMLHGEGKAEISKTEAGKQAHQEGNGLAASFFNRAARDEARHKAGLQAYLDKYFS